METKMDKEQLYQLDTLMKAIPLYGKKVGLRNIERIITELNTIIPLVEYLNSVHVIHVTGTNGKGSVCKMLSEIYTEQGYCTGLFTSPHIDVITERIQINNNNVSGELFYDGYQAVLKICERLKTEDIEPTFFEWVFSIALYCFYMKKAKVLVIEVGIGGRLDTTNILPKKELSVITSVGLDHQDILGNTLTDIAIEKTGILPKNGRLVLGKIDKEAEKVIRQIAVKKEALVYNIQPNAYEIMDFTDKSIDFSVHNKYYNYERLHLNTSAHYQINNALIALLCIHVLQDVLLVDESSVKSGLDRFFWPGRFERIQEGIYIDGAHNVLGVTTLLESIALLSESKSYDLLLGMKQHKDYKAVIRLLLQSGWFKNIYLVELSGGIGVSKQELYDEVSQYSDSVYYVEDLQQFLQERLYKQSALRLLATGSLFLTSDIRKILQEEEAND